MDLVRASDELDRLIERRAGEGSAANGLSEMYAESVRKHRARIRREHRALWFAYYSNLAASLKTSADWYEARAAELLDEEQPKGAA